MSKLIDIAMKIGSGVTPLRTKSEYWSSKKYRWLKTEQLGDFKIYDTFEYISQLAVCETNIKIWNRNTVSVAMYGEGKTRGSVSILAEEMATNQACCNIEVDANKADYRYVYYWLKNNYENLRALSSGVRKNLNSDDIKEFEIEIKKPELQEKIANILFSLDQKIETNNKINAELEKMAKTLYDYWFVQFDFPDENGKPYHTNGGAMTYKEVLKRDIPTGWQNGTFSTMIDECVGGEWGEENAFNDSIKVNCLRGADVGELIAGNYPNCPTLHIGNSKQSKLILDTAIVIEISGGSPTQSTGRSTLITKELIKDFDDKVVCSNFCRAIVSKVNYDYYLYGLLQSYYKNGIFFNFEGKTTGIKNLLLDSFFASKIVIPSEAILTKFNKKAEILYTLRSKKIIENKQLAELREFLLPLLMTGQVQVQSSPKMNVVLPINKDKSYYEQRFELWRSNQGLAARGSINLETLRELFDAMEDDDK